MGSGTYLSIHPESGDTIRAAFNMSSKDTWVTWFELSIGDAHVTVFLPKDRWVEMLDAVQVAYEEAVNK
jgi:hypothetical protein